MNKTQNSFFILNIGVTIGKGHLYAQILAG